MSASCETRIEHAAIVANSGPIRPDHFSPADALASNGAAEAVGSVMPGLGKRTHRWRRPAGAPRRFPAHRRSRSLGRSAAPRTRECDGEAARWLGQNRATVRKKIGEYELGDTAAKTIKD